MLRIVIVGGSRPELIKIAPLFQLQESYPDLSMSFVHVTPHIDRKTSEAILQGFGISSPEHVIYLNQCDAFSQEAEIFLSFRRILERTNPDLVVVIGDSLTAVACSLATIRFQKPLAHIAATGLKSGNRSMPEEINSILINAMADHHFVVQKSDFNDLKGASSSENHVFKGQIVPQDEINPDSWDSHTVERIMTWLSEIFSIDILPALK